MIKLNLKTPANPARLAKLRIIPVGRWVSPQNPTIIGDANCFGELIPGRVWSGGKLTTDAKREILRKEYPMLTQIMEKLGESYPILQSFVYNVADPFFTLVSDRYAARIALQIMALDLSNMPRGHIMDDSEISYEIVKNDKRVSISSGMRVFVYQDYVGSLYRIFQILHEDHWDMRFVKNFNTEGSATYATTFAFPKGAATDSRTRYHGIFEIVEKELLTPNLVTDLEEREQLRLLHEKLKKYFKIAEENKHSRLILETPEDKIDLEKTTEDVIAIMVKKKRVQIMKSLQTEFPLKPEAEIEKMVSNYLRMSLPQIYLLLKPDKIAEFIRFFYRMRQQKQRIVVALPRPQEMKPFSNGRTPDGVKTLMISIKDERVTPILPKICKLLKDRGIDIRYFLLESLEDKEIGNRTLIKIGVQEIHKDERGERREPISLDTFYAIQELIEKIGNPTFGVKSLLYDILGPIMIGPSSSHTAGACKIGRLSRNMIKAFLRLGLVKEEAHPEIKVEMVGTFALDNTGKGHYSDLAVYGGLQGKKEDDPTLADVKPPEEKKETIITINGRDVALKPSTDILQNGLEHPNTIRIKLTFGEDELEIVGASIGGGIIGIQSINGRKFEYEAEHQAIRGNKNLYFVTLKNDAQYDAFKAWASQKHILQSVVQYKRIKVGGKTIIVFCASKPMDFKKYLPDIIEKVEEVELIAEAPAEIKVPSEFNSFSEALQLVGSGKYRSFGELAIEYEKKLTAKMTIDGKEETDGDVIDRIKKAMKERLDVMLNSVITGNNRLLSVGDIEIGNLSELLLNFAIDVPLTKEQFRERMLGILKVKQNRGEIREEFQGKKPLRPPFEAFEVWPYVTSNPFVAKVIENFLGEREGEELAGFIYGLKEADINQLYDKIVDAWKMNPMGKNIYSYAMAYAESASAVNAQMGKIVAAPTAGSVGVLPGVLTALKKFYGYNNEELFTPEKLTEALFTASLIGLIINDKIPTAGGTGGCQAELGAATAMAAGAATQLLGGNAKQVLYSVALSLQFLEGLVCDPIGGYVVWPCISRNGLAAMVALGAAWQAVNMKKSLLSADAAVDGLVDTGLKMHHTLKELGRDGGLTSSEESRVIGEQMKTGRMKGGMMRSCPGCDGCKS